MRKSHPQVEFAVDDAGGRERIFDTFDEAASYAVMMSLAKGRPHNVDVLVFGRAGARWWAGDTGVEMYNDDPDASVFQRIVIRADDVGRVP